MSLLARACSRRLASASASTSPLLCLPSVSSLSSSSSFSYSSSASSSYSSSSTALSTLHNHLTATTSTRLPQHPSHGLLRRQSLHTSRPHRDEASASPAESEPAAEPSPLPEMSPKVQKLVDDIMGLNVMEAVQLVDVLKVKFNYVEQAPVMAMAGAVAPAGDGGAEAEGEPEPEVEKAWAVKLISFSKEAKLKLVKEVRTITGLGLKESKEMVEAVPALIKEDMGKEDAKELMEKLVELGGECELV